MSPAGPRSASAAAVLLLLLVGLVVVREDERFRSALHRHDQHVAGQLIAEPRAPVAEDAALAVEIDERRDLDRLLRTAASVRGSAIRSVRSPASVLQRHSPAAIADRAIERVIDQQQLEDRLLCVVDLLGRVLRVHDHPPDDTSCTTSADGADRSRDRRRTFDVDETHSARADRSMRLCQQKRGTKIPRRSAARSELTGASFDRLAVDRDRDGSVRTVVMRPFPFVESARPCSDVRVVLLAEVRDRRAHRSSREFCQGAQAT